MQVIRRCLFMLVCGLGCFPVFADTPALLWQSYSGMQGGPATGITQSRPDSNFVLLQRSIVNRSGTTFTGVNRLIKFDKENGAIIWATSDSIPNADSLVVKSGIFSTEDSGFVVVGGTLPTSVGGQNQVFCVKYDSLGQRVAISTHTSPPLRYIILEAAARRPEGGVVAVGEVVRGTEYYDHESFVVAFDQDGGLTWTIQDSLFPDGEECTGGIGYAHELLKGVAWKGTGEGLAVGYKGCIVQQDIFSVPFTNGGFGAPTILQPSDYVGDPTTISVANTIDGGYIVAIYYREPSHSYFEYDTFAPKLFKLSASGSVEWSRVLEVFEDVKVEKIIQTPDEMFVVLARDLILGHQFLAKIDEDGNTIWQRWFDNLSSTDTTIESSIQTMDGGYAFTGREGLPPVTSGFAMRLGADSLNIRHISIPYRFGQPHVIDCRLLARRPDATLTLYYRSNGGNYSAVIMDSLTTSAFFTSEIPAEATVGDSLEYFIEMEEGGTVVGRARSVDRPFTEYPYWKMNNGTTDYAIQSDNWSYTNSYGSVWTRQWTIGDGPLEYCLSCGANNTNLCFPDWDLFTYAFGPHQTEVASPIVPAPRQPIAQMYWRLVKNCWQGSCFGFSTTSAIFFQGAAALQDSFPGAPSLFAAPNNDRAKNIINGRQVMLRSAIQDDYESAHFYDTPRQTIEGIREMLSAPVLQARTLSIGNDYRGGAHPIFYHAVLPIELRKTGAYTYTVECYDPNYPTLSLFIDVDLIDDQSAGVFSVGLYSPSEVASPGPFFLNLPVSTVMGNPPLFSWSARTECADQTDPIRIFTGTGIHNVSGPGGSVGFGIGEGGFHTYNTIAGAVPVVQPTGLNQTPGVWDVPTDEYTIDLGSVDQSFDESEAKPTHLAIHSGCVWMSAERAGMTPEFPMYFSDQYVVRPSENSLEVLAPQIEAESYVLSIVEKDGGSERSISVENIAHLQGESMRIQKLDSAYLFDNDGAADSVDIMIVAVNGGDVQDFVAHGVLADGGARLIVTADWSSLPDTLPIFVDQGMDDSIDDTIWVPNEVQNIPCDSLPLAKAPEELVLQLQADSTLRLFWNAVTEDVTNEPIVVDHYVVFGSLDPSFAVQEELATTTDNTWVDTTHVASEGQFFYRVTAQRCP